MTRVSFTLSKKLFLPAMVWNCHNFSAADHSEAWSFTDKQTIKSLNCYLRLSIAKTVILWTALVSLSKDLAVVMTPLLASILKYLSRSVFRSIEYLSEWWKKTFNLCSITASKMFHWFLIREKVFPLFPHFELCFVEFL